MNRILSLQKMESVGVERAAMLNGEAESTCSWVGCGPSTASCVGCCEVSCDITIES